MTLVPATVAAALPAEDESPEVSIESVVSPEGELVLFATVSLGAAEWASDIDVPVTGDDLVRGRFPASSNRYSASLIRSRYSSA